MTDPKDNTTTTLQAEVAQRVATGVPVMREMVIAELAANEQRRQAALITSGLNKLDGLQRDLRKIDRPDVVEYDRNGAKVGEGTFSKARAEEISKLEKQIKKGNEALVEGWGNLESDPPVLPKFDKLAKFVNNKGNEKEEPEES